MFASMFRNCSGYGITWKVILTFLFPVLFLPLPILWPGSVSRCLYVLSLMGSYWSVSCVSSFANLGLLHQVVGAPAHLCHLPHPSGALSPPRHHDNSSGRSEIKQVVTNDPALLGQCLLPQVLLHAVHGRANGSHSYRALQHP